MPVQIALHDILHPDTLKSRIAKDAEEFSRLDPEVLRRTEEMLAREYEDEEELTQSLSKLSPKASEAVASLLGNVAMMVDWGQVQELGQVLSEAGLSQGLAEKLQKASRLLATPPRDGASAQRLSDKLFRQLISEYITRVRLAPDFVEAEDLLKELEQKHKISRNLVEAAFRLCHEFVNAYVRYTIGTALLRRALVACNLTEEKADILVEMVDKHRPELRWEYLLSAVYALRRDVRELRSRAESPK